MKLAMKIGMSTNFHFRRSNNKGVPGAGGKGRQIKTANTPPPMLQDAFKRRFPGYIARELDGAGIESGFNRDFFAFLLADDSLGIQIFAQGFMAVFLNVSNGGADLGIESDAPESIFSCDLADQAIQSAFPGVPCADLPTGIERGLTIFRTMVSDGRLSIKDLPGRT